MMPSRGMGAIAPAKMPKRKTTKRKDSPEKVDTYRCGAPAKKGK